MHTNTQDTSFGEKFKENALAPSLLFKREGREGEKEREREREREGGEGEDYTYAIFPG